MINMGIDMKLTMLDRSTYLKGLMLLIKKDNVIAESEKKLMIKIGQTLGFDKSFIETSIKDLMDNQYITDNLPTFSNVAFAESFILDGLKVAFSDNDFAPEEMELLTSIAEQNGIEKDKLMSLIADYVNNSDKINNSGFLFITKYLDNEYSEPEEINV